MSLNLHHPPDECDHTIRYVLCHNDGTEIANVPPEKVASAVAACERAAFGFVKVLRARKRVAAAETSPPAT